MIIFSYLMLLAEVFVQTVSPCMPVPVTMGLAPETLKSITHIWHTRLISDHSPLDRIWL